MSDRGQALGFAVRFYLGVGAPAERRRYPEGVVRAAAGYAPELVRALVGLYLEQADPRVGTVERVNFRSARVTLRESGATYFVKEFPRRHFAHDVERALRLSRVDRAWRGAHLLPSLGLDTPAAIGTASRRDDRGTVVEYLATEWVGGAVPFIEALPAAGERRLSLLREVAALMRLAHRRGVYSRDFVKNVLVRQEGEARRYWLIDLDGLHPIRRVNRRRVLFHLREFGYYCSPAEEEVGAVCEAYLGRVEGAWAARLQEALRGGRGNG